ncbi:MAG: multifunctional oxoglutarate decarboxylase/oxoglutarate dehydrogenase thiamine pyrophosphate-binding subunit/dihydrolipoyllysine-residue succinyltransferase subunit [Pyrinomonadaceae bacterium]
MNERRNIGELQELIAEQFGANADYVEGLLNRFLSDPALVDETWREHFTGMLNGQATNLDAPENGNALVAATPTGNGNATTVAPPAEATKKQMSGLTLVQQKPASASPAAPAKPDANEQAQPIRGSALKLVENMETSLSVPTATSQRRIPVKVLEENRALINRFLKENDLGKASFTHLIAYALLQALKTYPQLNDGFSVVDNTPARLRRAEVNLGVAIDLERKDGTRTLLVPNIKNAGALLFPEFLRAYDDVVKRARDGKLGLSDFQDTTLSLTNPGTIGTVASQPRLMAGQGVIIATGAIEYPAEYHAMTPEALSQLGISKSVTVSSTYDHRIIQGAESGQFLKLVHELLLGEHNFYDEIFKSLGLAWKPMRWSVDHNPTLLGGDHRQEQIAKQAHVIELINAYRAYGHLIADIDPLHAMPTHHHPELDLETYGLSIWDLDREFITGGLGGTETTPLREIIDLLRRSYCGRVGVEYAHIQDSGQRAWLRERMEAAPPGLSVETKKALLWKLISAEQFERFLHTRYLGQKRFSIEGCETLIPLLDQMIEGAATRGVEDITLGMAHRGRINVLANVIGHFCERIFTAFEGSVHPNFPADEGDVKYHQGARGEREAANNQKVKLILSPNPSHLEFVDAVVVGMVRAKQDLTPGAREEVWDKALPVLLHGDAAFSGQGVVMETLNLAELKGYRVGGTVHIIINNQIGFTTSPEAGRSTIYSTDIAKMTQLPIFHVNADDPEAAFRVLQIALDYRQEFNRDVVIDLVGFRRLGHNESDEPSYTQPLMYARVKTHEGVRAKYAGQLLREGVITESEAQELIEERVRRYERAQAAAKETVAKKPKRTELTAPIEDEDGSAVVETPVSAEVVREIGERIARVPEGFHVNPKMVSQLARRAKMGEGSAPMDWAFAEAVAFGSLVREGTHVRLSGQDSGRGTFSQRHAVLYDTQTGQAWTPLSEIRVEGNDYARFEVFDSSLSELAVLGFEYGYTVESMQALVMWEAQFGDFSNGAQVIIDQFIASGEDKWKQTSRLTLLLPHGYEGQGPEHSSARLERYLQLCAENNMQVCYPSTPAQYFHLLRRQVKQQAARPLIVMTPKSLLRLPAASSTVEELTKGGFRPVIDDAEVKNREAIKRIVLCSGKVFYDLQDARRKAGEEEGHVSIVRLEQFYPFPENALREIFATYPNVKELVWTQEEPQSMGGWHFVQPRLMNLLPACERPVYVGRTPSASPATGSYTTHELEQQQLVQAALQTAAPQTTATSQMPKMGTDG